VSHTIGAMTTRQRGREILERSIHAIAENAQDAYRLIEKLDAAGFPHDGPTMLAAKHLRMELLQTKGGLERELGRWVRDCLRCKRWVYWVPGVGPEPGHWAHAEPAPIDHLPQLS
jgi:hypothetical protein